MIRRIRGLLAGVHEESVMVDVNGLTYEVFLPPYVREKLEGRPLGSQVELSTYHYLHSDPAKAVPVLLGFENDMQRDFFELLTDVPRLGPRAALRAFALPVSTLARAIELQDAKLLRSLPGIGAQKAKDIIATLAGKLGRFLDQAAAEGAPQPLERPLEPFEDDAVEVLTRLGMGRAEAIRAIQQVRETDPALSSAQEIIKRVFQTR